MNREMNRISIDNIEDSPHPREVHEIRRRISPALGVEHVALTHFELKPGESLSGGLHAHTDQEEIFIVEQGTATFEVGTERRKVTVESGEVIRFDKGEFQVGRNKGEEVLVCLAVGAPGSRHKLETLKAYEECVQCGEETVHETGDIDDGALELICETCDNVQKLE